MKYQVPKLPTFDEVPSAQTLQLSMKYQVSKLPSFPKGLKRPRTPDAAEPSKDIYTIPGSQDTEFLKLVEALRVLNMIKMMDFKVKEPYCMR